MKHLEEQVRGIRLVIEWSHLKGAKVHQVNNILLALQMNAELGEETAFRLVLKDLAEIMGPWVYNNPRVV